MKISKDSKKWTKAKISDPSIAANIMFSILAVESDIDRDKEHFWLISLTAANTIKAINLITLGILNSSLVHPREVFRQAIANSANSIIIAHNHPSGETNPSHEDTVITKRLTKCGKLLDIPIMDHIIIGNISPNNYYSYREMMPDVVCG
jgi:DNA repair protein RadC